MPFNALISDDTSYELRVNRDGRGPVACESEHTTSVVRVDFFKHPPVAAGFGLLSDLLAELAESTDLSEDRKAFARETMRNEPLTLTRLRLEKGLSQAELAAAIGTSQAAVSRLEAGEQEPRLTTLRKLASALGVDLNIVGGAFPNV